MKMCVVTGMSWPQALDFSSGGGGSGGGGPETSPDRESMDSYEEDSYPGPEQYGGLQGSASPPTSHPTTHHSPKQPVSTTASTSPGNPPQATLASGIHGSAGYSYTGPGLLAPCQLGGGGGASSSTASPSCALQYPAASAASTNLPCYKDMGYNGYGTSGYRGMYGEGGFQHAGKLMHTNYDLACALESTDAGQTQDEQTGSVDYVASVASLQSLQQQQQQRYTLGQQYTATPSSSCQYSGLPNAPPH